MKNRNWNDNETNTAIVAYLIMRSAVDRGEKFNKAKIVRELRGVDKKNKLIHPDAPLANRKRSAIEMKFMNISAVMRAIGRLDCSMENHGYKCLGNIQKSMIDSVKTVLASKIVPMEAA